MCTPCALAGISALVNATRRPVADALSFLVCATLEGNGSRHPRFGVPLHVAAEAAEGSSASAPITPSSLRFIAADLSTAVSRELRSEPRGATALRDAAPMLRVGSNYAVGFENVDLAACQARGVVVGTTGGVLTDATADLAMALLLAAARHLVAARDDARAGRWRTWEPQGYVGL